jgi:hypothetical protein
MRQKDILDASVWMRHQGTWYCCAVTMSPLRAINTAYAAMPTMPLAARFVLCGDGPCAHNRSTNHSHTDTAHGTLWWRSYLKVVRAQLRGAPNTPPPPPPKPQQQQHQQQPHKP